MHTSAEKYLASHPLLHTVYAGSEITKTEIKLWKFLSAYFDSLYQTQHLFNRKVKRVFCIAVKV